MSNQQELRKHIDALESSQVTELQEAGGILDKMLGKLGMSGAKGRIRWRKEYQRILSDWKEYQGATIDPRTTEKNVIPKDSVQEFLSSQIHLNNNEIEALLPSHPKKGDYIIYNKKKFVWMGAQWGYDRGDKGSLQGGQIDNDAALETFQKQVHKKDLKKILQKAAYVHLRAEYKQSGTVGNLGRNRKPDEVVQSPDMGSNISTGAGTGSKGPKAKPAKKSAGPTSNNMQKLAQQIGIGTEYEALSRSIKNNSFQINEIATNKKAAEVLAKIGWLYLKV